MLNPSGVEKSRPIMPMSTSAELGSVPAREGGRVSMLTRGSSWLNNGEEEEEAGGEGLERRSMRGSGAGVFSMRSESGVVDTVVERMVGNEVERMAVGCLL